MMLSKQITILVFLLFIIGCGVSRAQQKMDTSIKQPTSGVQKKAKDSLKKFNPRIATFRSAIFPGWGQIYNKKYWKLGLIYPALGITAGVFFYNLKTYKQLRQAYIYKTDSNPLNDTLIPLDLALLSAESLRAYRNEFRQNIDYSVLVFLIFWGLNVVDATVDAHLKAFDVSDEISMKFKPRYDPLSNQSGIGLVFSFKDKHLNHPAPIP